MAVQAMIHRQKLSISMTTAASFPVAAVLLLMRIDQERAKNPAGTRRKRLVAAVNVMPMAFSWIAN
jgi:hypothetical protein